MTCSEIDCDRKVLARGLCGKHYQAATKYNRLPPRVVDNSCSGPVVARGMCNKHWRRAKKAGLFQPQTPRPRGTLCEADGCDQKAKAQGLCAPHYRKKQGYKSKPLTSTQNTEYRLRKGLTPCPPRHLPYRVLARSCPQCGLLLTTPDHLIRRDAGPLPKCSVCSVQMVLRTKKRRLARGDEEYRRRLMKRADKVKKRLNDATREEAANLGKQWTSAEMEVAARTDLTARQVAILLGRTMYAVRHKRAAIKRDPRAESLVGQDYVVANQRAEHIRKLVSA